MVEQLLLQGEELLIVLQLSMAPLPVEEVAPPSQIPGLNLLRSLAQLVLQGEEPLIVGELSKFKLQNSPKVFNTFTGVRT